MIETVQNVRRRSWTVGWIVAVLLLTPRLEAEVRFTRESEVLDEVIELVDRRLALMREVAAVKYRQQRPIADPAREREVIEQSSADAAAIHLDRAVARHFFAAQIVMARAVQGHLFEHWRSRDETPPAARDLGTEIRPQLDAIGREMLPALYLASAACAEIPVAELGERVNRLVRHPGLTPELLDPLVRALAAMRITAGATLQSVQRVGVLRIGTTGDYAPFSDDRGGELRGVDVELASALAKGWGVTPVFVRTSWPTLMTDLTKRRFDVAMSGISITPERVQRAAFSVPYFFDGKMPIARRTDAARYATLDAIDQPGVRLVVNPGGTNERFVREHIKRAAIAVHPDNRTIFDEIIAGRADLMITDSIEVRLQTLRHPELRATTTVPLTRVGKAILLPKDSELAARIDPWLKPQVERGEVAVQLETALQNAR